MHYFSVGALTQEIYRVFCMAGNGELGASQLLGFVHAYPLIEGRVSFYSDNPAKWADKIGKRSVFKALWRQYRGNVAGLTRYGLWRVVATIVEYQL